MAGSVGSAPVETEQPPEEDPRWDAAADAIEAGNWDEAIALYEQLRAVDPEQAQAAIAQVQLVRRTEGWTPQVPLPPRMPTPRTWRKQGPPLTSKLHKVLPMRRSNVCSSWSALRLETTKPRPGTRWWSSSRWWGCRSVGDRRPHQAGERVVLIPGSVPRSV